MGLDFKKDLNGEQYEAASCDARYLRIIAGAGTGKTRTLTYRLAHLIARGDMQPNQIVAITFTNKAANEMKTRTEKILSLSNMPLSGLPVISTFHGFCYRFLRKELADHYKGFSQTFMVADETDQKEIFKTVGEKFNLTSDNAWFKDMIETIYRFKTKGLEWDEIKEDDFVKTGQVGIKDIYQEYQTELAKNNLVDFDDLLIFTRDIMLRDQYTQDKWRAKYRAFMIDEFQDTNDLQYQIVRLFMAPNSELTVVGDPDQTIYTWRGADNSIIKTKLERDFPSLKTVTLDINYRSTQKILDKANMLIKNNHNRVDKSLSAFTKEVGEDVDFLTLSENNEEAQTIAYKIKKLHTNNNVPYKDIAIIYRSNFLSRVFEKWLPASRIPYKLYGATNFYERVEVKAGLSYLRLLIDTSDTVSFRKVLQSPSRKIGDKTLDSLFIQANQYQEPVFQFLLDHMDTLVATPSVKASLQSLVSAYKAAYQAIQGISDSNQYKDIIENYFTNTGLYGYVQGLDQKDSEKGDSEKDNARENNLNELVTALQEYISSSETSQEEDADPTLTGFLVNVALTTNQDEMKENEDQVAVMTGHVSKGLEFGYVFVTGLVDAVFPTSHAIQDTENGKKEAMEEERRLFYVAITRAKKYLCISTFGGMNYSGGRNVPSRFLKEIGYKSSREQTGFLYSARTDRHSGYQSPYAKQNSSYSNSMFRQIDRYASSHGYVSDPNDYGTTGLSQPIPTHVTGRGLVRSNFSNANSNDVEYKIGDKIAHASFGIGVVKAVEGNKITVDFGAENGTKTLLKGFKAFKKIN
jgi:DNA helicase II / ATP-dependent DNA helicase PcrA